MPRKPKPEPEPDLSPLDRQVAAILERVGDDGANTRAHITDLARAVTYQMLTGIIDGSYPIADGGMAARVARSMPALVLDAEMLQVARAIEKLDPAVARAKLVNFTEELRKRRAG